MPQRRDAYATTEINGGDWVTFVDDDGCLMTVAAVLREVELFLEGEDDE